MATYTAPAPAPTAAQRAPRPPDRAFTADVDLARDGDELAFGRLYRALQPGLLRYLTAVAGNEAEDVASETWAQVCRSLHQFHGDIDNFRGWLTTIGRNRAIDHLRARGRRPFDPVAVEDLHALAAADDTEGAALDALSTRQAVAIIASLPRDQAEAVLLRSVVGLDAKRAGEVLGKRPGAVRGAAFRGLHTLAHRLSAASGEWVYEADYREP